MRLIDAEELKEHISELLLVYSGDDSVILDAIDNASTLEDRYDEGYAQGYIDGSTEADMRGDMNGM